MLHKNSIKEIDTNRSICVTYDDPHFTITSIVENAHRLTIYLSIYNLILTYSTVIYNY